MHPTPFQLDLLTLIRRLSYKEGVFVLASGKTSSFYIDLKTTTLHPDGAFLIGKLAADIIAASGLHVQAVGGLTLGADPIATALSLEGRARGESWPALIVRKEPKAHGTSRYIEGIENVQAGAKVLVLEDVVTSGGSSLKAIDRLQEAGLRPVAVLTVVDRCEGGREQIEARGLRFLALTTIAEIARQ